MSAISHRKPLSEEEVTHEGDRLRTELLTWMAEATQEAEAPQAGPGNDPVDLPSPPGERFEELALRILRFQARANPVYGRLLHGRGLEPEALEHWTAFPAVPARAFRDAPPWAATGTPEARFRTSGTTGTRPDERGEHRVRHLALYHASLLPPAIRYLGLARHPRFRVVALLPNPSLRPASSLAHMAGVLAARFGDDPAPPHGHFLVRADDTLDVEAATGALEAARHDRVPVLLLTTAFGLVHLLDHLGSRTLPLPSGSRCMETGGYKGRSRELSRRALVQATTDALGLPPTHVVNEYGMTEMLSQFWEPVLVEEGPADPELRRHVPPPWVRTRVLDPVTLAPVEPGRPGLLCHLDLANLHAASLLLTEDQGVVVPGPEVPGGAGASGPEGFRVLGRLPGAELRGCSLSMEAWLEARR